MEPLTPAASVLPPRPLQLEELAATSWQVLRRKPVFFLALFALWIFAVCVVLGVMSFVGMMFLVLGLDFDGLDLPRLVPPTMQWATVVLTGLTAAVLTLVTSLFTSLLVAGVEQTLLGRRPTWSSTEQRVKGWAGRCGALVLWAAAVTVAVVAPFVFALAALVREKDGMDALDGIFTLVFAAIALSFVLGLIALVLQVKLVYVWQVLALEQHSGMALLRRAWRLTAGRFWRTLGFIAVGALLPWLAQAALQTFTGYLGRTGEMAPLVAVLGLLSFAVSLLAGLWGIIWQTVMYLDARRWEPGTAAPLPPAPLSSAPLPNWQATPPPVGGPWTAAPLPPQSAPPAATSPEPQISPWARPTGGQMQDNGNRQPPKDFP